MSILLIVGALVVFGLGSVVFGGGEGSNFGLLLMLAGGCLAVLAIIRQGSDQRRKARLREEHIQEIVLCPKCDGEGRVARK